MPFLSVVPDAYAPVSSSFSSARMLKRSRRFGKCHEVDEMNGINGLNNLLARGSKGL